MSGLAILRMIQSFHSPSLDIFFRLVTDLHQLSVYVAALPLLFWYFDRRFARYITSILMIGLWSNGALKDWFGTARPMVAQVRVLHPESGGGYAFPSGHAQNTLMFWGPIAQHLNRRWFTILAGVVLFLIGLSRLYLGLHWPIDVLGGWAIGALMMAGFHITRRFWTGAEMGFLPQLLCALVVPLMTLLAWQSSPWRATQTEAGESWILTGAYMGLWVGSVLEERFVRFDHRAAGLGMQLLKALVGFSLVLTVKQGVKPLLPATAMADLVRYLLVGLTASLGAPWVFQRLGITPPLGGRSPK